MLIMGQIVAYFTYMNGSLYELIWNSTKVTKLLLLDNCLIIFSGQRACVQGAYGRLNYFKLHKLKKHTSGIRVHMFRIVEYQPDIAPKIWLAPTHNLQKFSKPEGSKLNQQFERIKDFLCIDLVFYQTKTELLIQSGVIVDFVTSQKSGIE